MSGMHRSCTILLPLVLLAPLACDAESEPADHVVADSAAHADSAQASLYDRLGGEAAIRSVVDTLVARAAADEELNFTRAGTANEWEPTPENIDTLKVRLVQFVASATGGSQRYEGQDMATAHRGMEITDAEFDRLGGHLRTALQAHDVPQNLQDELFAIVESTRAQIVTAE